MDAFRDTRDEQGNGWARTPELPPELDSDRLPGALFGYDRYTIEKLLAKLRERFEELWHQSAERGARIKDLELELLRGKEDERVIGETLISAQREAQSIKEKARREAQELVKAARKRAERIREESEREATATAKELVESAERERDALLNDAQRARVFIEQTHEQLSDFLLAAVKWYEEAKPSIEDRLEQPQLERPQLEEPQPKEPEPPAGEEPSAPPNEQSSIASA